MGRNTFRANVIRKIVFGKDNREPIAKSIEKKLEACGRVMDEIEDEHNDRVNLVRADPIPGMDDYYLLTFVQAEDE